MPTSYNLDNKIAALNLLDQLDGDFRLVNAQLDIPVKTLKHWRADEKKLRVTCTKTGNTAASQT